MKNMQKRLPKLFLALGLLACLFAGPINASVITHTIDFDISTLIDEWGSGGKYWMGYNVPQSITPFTANAGDTLNTTVNFLPGQSITVHNGNTIWGFGFEGLTIAWDVSGGYTGDHSTSTSSVTLFSNMGNVILGGTTTYGVLAQTIFGNITNTDLTFTGFSMITSITSIPAVYEYDQFKFWAVNSGQTDLNQASTVVPEPGTLLLVGSGVIALLIGRRKLGSQIG